MLTSCQDCTLRRKACFHQLTSDELNFVTSMQRGQAELAPGRFLYKEGDKPKALYTLYEGWAAGCSALPGQTQQISEVLLPGDLLGAPASLAGRHNRSLVALTRIRYCVLDVSLIESLCRSGGTLCYALMQSLMAHRMRREKVTTLLRRGGPLQRLAYLFADIFARLKAIGVASDTMCPFPLHRSQLAEIVGLSEVHVSRTLAAMRKDGLIEIANNILVIPEEERLVKIAGLKPLDCFGERLII
jgi:CRP/FNR family transcriptional regulator, anaerobic regulatory protein